MKAPDPSLENLTIGEPAWRVALLFPPQGSWTEQDYLALDAGNLVEYDEGCIEVLDMPTKAHQRLVRGLFVLLNSYVSQRSLGEVFFAPLPVRLWNKKFREPDIVFVSQNRTDYQGYPNGADLVIEVVSESPADRKRDLIVKLDEYCQAGISEYWIVDPAQSTIIVNTLQAAKYVPSMYLLGQTARSVLLDGFLVELAAVFEDLKT